MADYSDETLRALIRQLITEDIPNLAIGPQANPDRRGLLTTQALLLLKKVFSPGGFVALATMGLIFDREHTKDLLEFGLDEFENIAGAVTVFNDTNGDVFERLAAASAAHGSKARENKYRYLQSLKKAVAAGNGSLSQQVVESVLSNYKKYEVGPNISGDPITEQDRAIYNAIASGEIDNAFDSNQFETSSTGQTLKIREFNHSDDYDDDVAKLYEAEITKAEAASKYINANIIEALRKSHEFTTSGKLEQAAEQFNIAIDIYNLAEEGNLDDLEKVVMFERIEDVERNFGNGFIASIKKKATEKAGEAFDNLVSKATDTVKKRLGPGNKKEK
jgi:hypothetical protein